MEEFEEGVDALLRYGIPDGAARDHVTRPLWWRPE